MSRVVVVGAGLGGARWSDEDAGHGRIYLARETIERFGGSLAPGRRETLLRDQILRQIERDGYRERPGRAVVPAQRKLAVVARGVAFSR